MALPIIISYSQGNLNSLGQNPMQILNELSGNNICLLHYNEPLNGHKKIRMIVQGKEWDIIVEIGRDHLCFCNPWFRKSKTMEAIIENNAIIKECDLHFVNSHKSPLSYLLDMGKSESLAEIRDLIIRSARLKKPIVPLHKEEEREIWTAYCEGLNALNKERRNFITLDSVGKPILYNDTKYGEIYTIKLSIGKDTVESLPLRIEEMLKDKLRIKDIIFNEERTVIEIRCIGTEKIIDEDIEDISELVHNYGFIMPNDGISNVLKASVYFVNHKERNDLYDKLDIQLKNKGIKFNIDSSLIYTFNNDTDVASFIEIANDIFKNICHAKPLNKIKVSLELKEEKRNLIRELLSSEEKISISDNSLCIMSENVEDYDSIKTKVETKLESIGERIIFPKYYINCKIEANEDQVIYRRTILRRADEILSDFRRISYGYEYDDVKARVIRFEFRFRNAAERENIIEQLSALVNTLGDSIKLAIKEPMGFTRILFKRTAENAQLLEDELRINYQGEDIKLVDGKLYRELFNNVTDPDNITDSSIRDKYNRFMNECPIIGTCYNRSIDSIIVKLSDEFYNGSEMKQFIRKGDMIYFPSVGTSTDLRRQYDAIQRINKPGQTINGRKIEPPINPQLSSFLFDPLFAHNIHQDITLTMQNIKSHKIESQLNEKQIEAVAKALLAPDICFIQGPPGTGKTTVIAEIIWQEIRRNPKCRILLTSQTNLAVDNALERLKYKRSIRPLRVISEQRIDNDEMIYNINLLDTWIDAPNEYNKNNVVEQWIDSIINRIDDNKKHSDVTSEWRAYLANKGKSVRYEFVSLYKLNVNIIAATCSICGSRIFRQMYEKMYNTDEVKFDIVIIDEASKATPLELAIPMVLGKKIIVIGDHKQLPPILDENSIDTALRKIGREDLAIKIQDLKESQFKKLFLLCQNLKPNLVTTLNIQYRMHKNIMNTINQFYVDDLGEGGLICGIEDMMDEPNFKTKGSRWHGITLEPIISPSTHAIWINVEGKENREYTSYKNYEEVKAVQIVINALTHADGFNEYIHNQERIEDKEIGIITFYSAQKRELKKLEQSGALDRFNDYRIDVVDRFQGMERNIVIVSTVRSNQYNGIGFAKEIERINVAFSRARSLLIVIGNRDLFYTKYNYRRAIDAMESVDIKQIEDLVRHGK